MGDVVGDSPRMNTNWTNYTNVGENIR